MYRTVFANASRSTSVSVRAFSTSHVSRKTVTEKVSEVASDLNKKAGKGLASAIEKGEKATEKVKETTSETIGSTKEKADRASTITSQKANKMGAEARATKEELKDAAK